MKNLYYADLEMQEYLMDKNITVQQVRVVFKYKTRMDDFRTILGEENQPNSAPSAKKLSVLTQPCIEMKDRYGKIFFSKIGVDTAKTLENILAFRKEYLDQ